MKRRLAVIVLSAPLAASAQSTFTLAAVSDYRVRGISLSDGEPAWQASANVDTDSGLYAGGMLSRARLRYTETDAMVMAYAGMARRFGEGWSWDVGASVSSFNKDGRYDYHELYAGIAHERWNVRLASSPRYFGVGGRTWYLDMNTSYPLGESLDLMLHLGHLRTQAEETAGPYGAVSSYSPAPRTDLRIGLAASVDAWNVQLAWSGTRHDATLYPGAQGRASALTLGVSRAF